MNKAHAKQIIADIGSGKLYEAWKGYSDGEQIVYTREEVEEARAMLLIDKARISRTHDWDLIRGVAFVEYTHGGPDKLNSRVRTRLQEAGETVPNSRDKTFQTILRDVENDPAAEKAYKLLERQNG